MTLPPTYIMFFMAGGLLLGVLLAQYWTGKSSIKKRRVRGQKREFFTNGEIIMMRLRLWMKRNLQKSS